MTEREYYKLLVDGGVAPSKAKEAAHDMAVVLPKFKAKFRRENGEAAFRKRFG